MGIVDLRLILKSESGLCCSAHRCSLVSPLGPALMLFRLREVQKWEDLRAFSYETPSLLNIMRAELSTARGTINVLRSSLSIQQQYYFVLIKNSFRNPAAA